jgi:hypothetical protein
VDVAKAGETRAQQANAAVLRELEHARARVHTYEELAGQLRQELAAAAATNAGLEERHDDLRRLQLLQEAYRLGRTTNRRAHFT